MLGHTHALTGLVAGAATLPMTPIGTPTMQIVWVGVWTGSALLPDLDHPGATVARMWGPLTTIAAKGVAVIARGHRGGTHDAVLGPLIFGGLALTATWHPTTTLALLALITGITLKGCAFVVPGKNKSTIGVNLLLSWTTAAWITHHSSGPPVWLPVAVAGGCLIHIIGDTLTTGGYPIPGTWLTARPRRYSLNLFATGAWPERWLLTPALTLTAIIFTARNITASDPVALIELLGVPA